MRGTVANHKKPIEKEKISTESAVIGVNMNHAAAIDLPAYIPDKSHFFPNLFPAHPANNVPMILAAPITEIAKPPRAAVVSIPRSPHQPNGSMGALISVISAGK